MTAIAAPRARAASIAAIVAAVPPSWLIPMTRPPDGGSCASSKAWAATGPQPGSPAARHASRRIAATPIAACSDVPQPVTTTGPPDVAATRRASARAAALPSAMTRRPIRAASAGSAATISAIAHGGASRMAGIGR